MTNAAEILKSVQIGLDVAIFFLNTDRGLQATELCNECLFLLHKIDSGIDLDHDISDILFNVYYATSGYTNAARYTTKLIDKFFVAGGLTIQLGDKYKAKCWFSEAKQLCKSALTIFKAIGRRREEAVVYARHGSLCWILSEYQKAKEYYEKALAITIEIGDRNGEEITYGSLGNLIQDLGEYQKAKEYNEKAIAIAIEIEIGDRNREGTTYGNLGGVFESLGKYQKAKEYHEKALAIAIEIGDRNGERRTYGNLGNVFQSLCEYQKAKEYYEKTLAIAIEIGDRNGEGTTYGNLGSVFQSLGEYQKAKEYHEKTIAIAIEIGDRNGEGRTYGNLGNVFQSLGEYQKAKEYHEKALAIAIEIGDRIGEGRTYGNLGSVFQSKGEYQKAKEYHEKALAIAIEIGDRNGEGTTYGNLGSVFQSLGEYQKAKEYHEKALAIAIEIGDRNREGTTYGNLGEIGDRNGEGTTYGDLGKVFQSLGEYQKAKEYYEKAIAIAKGMGVKGNECLGYLALGNVYCPLSKYRQAREEFDKALSIGTAIGIRGVEAGALTGLADVFAFINDNQKAKEHLQKALTISKECGDKCLEGIIYLKLGDLCTSLGECDEAEDYLEKARFMSSRIGDIGTEFKSLLCITLLKVSQSMVVEAKEHLLRCIGKYEQLRNFLKGNKEFEISLFEAHGSFPYQFLTNLLCNADKFQDALYVEELGRARVLVESMTEKFSVESHISADPQSWFGIENIVKKESNSVFLYISYRERQVCLWVLKANGDISFRVNDEVQDRTLIPEKVYNVEGIFKKSAASFGVLPTANCEDRSLDGNVTTSLFEESRATLRDDESKETERIHHLCYKWIIAPVADLLTEPEIIIVPDRFSYRVPFAALRDESAGKYLSETYRIRIVRSLTTLRLIQDCPADYHSETGALIVGDPTVGQAYYNGRVANFVPLSCARKEAAMVGRLLGVQPLLGESATKQAVLQAIPSVSLIHVAAHGNAERGEIALSPKCPKFTTNSFPQEEDYLLTMSDIFGAQVRAKLVVLSCCHSARGLVKAEGVLGIARAFLASGARSVLVASWAIADEATEQLMNHFYKHLVRGESASESLHQAVKWLRSNGFPKPKQWAPLVLMGDKVTFDFTYIGKEEHKEDNNKEEKKQSNN
ncbi:tetratricopeptide repeat protein 28-like [Pocillopora verrucosa]|uniref:tetratricopeptide repeat protein 28-like n=1 Tax=Pocillopora verrucosa TaxID=203993 RepID=UPI0033427A9B